MDISSLFFLYSHLAVFIWFTKDDLLGFMGRFYGFTTYGVMVMVMLMGLRIPYFLIDRHGTRFCSLEINVKFKIDTTLVSMALNENILSPNSRLDLKFHG